MKCIARVKPSQGGEKNAVFTSLSLSSHAGSNLLAGYSNGSFASIDCQSAKIMQQHSKLNSGTQPQFRNRYAVGDSDSPLKPRQLEARGRCGVQVRDLQPQRPINNKAFVAEKRIDKHRPPGVEQGRPSGHRGASAQAVDYCHAQFGQEFYRGDFRRA